MKKSMYCHMRSVRNSSRFRSNCTWPDGTVANGRFSLHATCTRGCIRNIFGHIVPIVSNAWLYYFWNSRLPTAAINCFATWIAVVRRTLLADRTIHLSVFCGRRTVKTTYHVTPVRHPSSFKLSPKNKKQHCGRCRICLQHLYFVALLRPF